LRLVLGLKGPRLFKMKIGVEDISISYELQQPTNGKKKFVRQTISAASGKSTPPQGRSISNSAEHSGRMNINNKPPKISINTTHKNNRPQSAVRFQDGPKATTPTTRRPPQSQSPAHSSRRSTQVPESPIHSRPVTPNRQVKTYGNEQRFPVTSFRQEYQSTTPIPAITRVRKELVYQDTAIPWNRSCNPPDRDDLRVKEDMAKNLRYKQKMATSQNTGGLVLRPRSAPAGHKKTIPDSFSRNRNSRTSGPILNLPYSELRRNVLPVEVNIHDKRWNCQTKDRDDDERAKPEGGKDTSLHAMYLKENAYYRRNRPRTGGAINKTQEFSYLFR
jgi:hypothetical protein